MERPTPRADQHTIPERSYCIRDGWRCTPPARCDEHRVDVDPARLREILDGTR